MSNNQDLRPAQVKVASSLLLLYWAFALINILLRHHPPTSYVAAAVLTPLFGSLLLCIWLISRGINWARLLFLALFVGDCWLALRSLPISPRSAMDAIFPCVQLLLQLLALVLLFLPTANRWFLRRAESA